jgi:GGDEF domain-containing protein
VLYSGDVAFFDDEERRLLNELADDIAFAMKYVEKEEKLEYLAYFDVLTGLPNSVLFRERLAQILDGARKVTAASSRFFLFDLDRFTHVKRHARTPDRRHAATAGGRTHRSIAARPSSVARISADTFAVAVAVADLGGGANGLGRHSGKPCSSRLSVRAS